MIGLVLPVPVNPPGSQVAVYPVIAEPPLLTGAVNVKDREPLPGVATLLVGAPDGVL